VQSHLKTPAQIDAMREGGKILATILHELRGYTRAGLNQLEIDRWVEERVRSYGALPTYITSNIDFPASICISVNEELVHSIPKDRILETGDKVSYDLTITYHDMCVDSAFSMVVDDEPKGAIKHLLSTTENSLYAGIEVIKAGAYTGDIGSVVEKTLTRGKLGVVRDYVGHGIGTKMHLPPDIPNFGRPSTGTVLKTGDTVCIEPMASLGKEKTMVLDDGWTVAMADHSICAHFEHTVLVTSTGYEILTQQ
jgi:methionyl aminopeptidase